MREIVLSGPRRRRRRAARAARRGHRPRGHRRGAARRRTTARRCRRVRTRAATPWRSASRWGRWREARQPSSRAVPPAHRRVGRLEDRVHRARRPRAARARGLRLRHDRQQGELAQRGDRGSPPADRGGRDAGGDARRASATSPASRRRGSPPSRRSPPTRLDWERLFRELAHVLPERVWLTKFDAQVGASDGRRRPPGPTMTLTGCADEPREDRRRAWCACASCTWPRTSS